MSRPYDVGSQRLGKLGQKYAQKAQAEAGCCYSYGSISCCKCEQRGARCDSDSHNDRKGRQEAQETRVKGLCAGQRGALGLVCYRRCRAHTYGLWNRLFFTFDRVSCLEHLQAMDIDVPVPSPWQTTTNGTQTDLQASQSASQGKKSRKRKRHSEHAAAGPSQPAVVNGNGHISGEEVDELASPAKTPPSDLSGLTQAHANVSVNGSPPKKKRKKQKNRQSEAAESSQASNVVKAPVPVPRPEQNSRPDSEANAAAAIVEEPPVIVNAAQEAEAVAAARRARKAEKKRRKAEKAAAALAAAQKAGGPAEAKSDNGNQAADIPVPQLNGGQEEPFMEDAEAALAAAAGRNQVNRDVVLANAVEATNEAPATSSSKKSSRKDKKSKKDKKGKGKAKEAATAVPLFQPEEDENKNDEERDELAEDSDAIPELPPPLKRTSNMPTSASRRAVSFVDVDENGAEVTQEEAEAEIDEDEAIDPVLRSPSKKQKKADKRKSKKNKTNAANPNSDTEENPNLGAASSSTSDIAASGSGRTLRQRTARNYQPPASPSASPQPAPFLLNSSAPAVHPMPVDGAKPLGPSSNTQENRDLLATKWMTAKQMAEIPGRLPLLVAGKTDKRMRNRAGVQIWTVQSR